MTNDERNASITLLDELIDGLPWPDECDTRDKRRNFFSCMTGIPRCYLFLDESRKQEETS